MEQVPETREELERALAICHRKLTELASQVETYRSQGRMILTDYGYFPKTRAWEDSPGIVAVERLLAGHADSYAALLDGFAEMTAYCAGVDKKIRAPGVPFWDNIWIPPLDAISLAGLVRHLRPATYLEVGSGMSTTFVREAIRQFALPTRLVSIDPKPRLEINALCDTSIRRKLEEADLDLFEELEPGDVLFVDNSHRSFPNSDVTVFFSEVLPRLKPGVVWGLHDIFLPRDYPDAWNTQNGRYYNEQYLFLAYLLGGTACDRPLLPNAWLGASPLVRRLEPLRQAAGLGEDAFGNGSCFWMVRTRPFGIASGPVEPGAR